MKIFIAVILVGLLLPGSLYAQGEQIGYAQELIKNKEYEKALPIILDAYFAYASNSGIKRTLMYILYREPKVFTSSVQAKFAAQEDLLLKNNGADLLLVALYRMGKYERINTIITQLKANSCDKYERENRLQTLGQGKTEGEKVLCRKS